MNGCRKPAYAHALAAGTQVLALLQGLQLLLISWRLLAPLPRGAGWREVAGCVVVNAVSLTLACSTYYSLCGNGGLTAAEAASNGVKAAVCTKWLHPIPTTGEGRWPPRAGGGGCLDCLMHAGSMRAPGHKRRRGPWTALLHA